MHALDIVDVHIWAPTPTSAYQEQVTDETTQPDVERARPHQPGWPAHSGVLDERDRELTRLGWPYDTPMAFVWEIGHADIYGAQKGAFCLPGQTFCGSFNAANWAGITANPDFRRDVRRRLTLKELGGGHRHGGKAEVLGNSFVGPTDCTGYGGPYCFLPVVLEGPGRCDQLRRRLSRAR